MSYIFCEGHSFYDWFIGRELNPRLGSLDLKYVMFRSGIIGWMLMNFASLILAFSEGKNEVPSNLVLLVITQLFYVIDYFWFEEGILVSRDIVHEGLGFNISMQFLMIPFTFCTQTRYVATTGYTSSWITLLGIFIIYGTCNYVLQWNLLPAKIFQTSNNRPLIFVLFCKRNWVLDLQSQ